jgi:undecaprenyl diphosphate synthase
MTLLMLNGHLGLPLLSPAPAALAGAPAVSAGPAPAQRAAPAPHVRLPRHVAVIMDGNGRWGTDRGLPRLAGHARGVEAAREAIAGCLERGIGTLSLYAFSTLNWRRPEEETHGLMELLRTYLGAEAEALAERGVRLKLLGERDGLPADVRAAAEGAEAATARGPRLALNLAINYGGREELVHAARRLAADVVAGRLSPEAVNEQRLQDALYTAGLPPVDLLIRTGGVRRLSNFLLWQAAYAELFFMDVLWPDFTRAHLDAALIDFAGRRRTFGGLVERTEG